MSSRLNYFPDNDLISLYRQVFSTNAGQEVLCHILFDLGAFIEVSDGPEDVALKNYGIRLLNILGGKEPSQESIKLMMNALMRQPLEKENKQ